MSGHHKWADTKAKIEGRIGPDMATSQLSVDTTDMSEHFTGNVEHPEKIDPESRLDDGIRDALDVLTGWSKPRTQTEQITDATAILNSTLAATVDRDDSRLHAQAAIDALRQARHETEIALDKKLAGLEQEERKLREAALNTATSDWMRKNDERLIAIKTLADRLYVHLGQVHLTEGSIPRPDKNALDLARSYGWRPFTEPTTSDPKKAFTPVQK